MCVLMSNILAMLDLDMPSLESRPSETFNGGSGSDLSMFSSSLPTLLHDKRMSSASVSDQFPLTYMKTFLLIVYFFLF